MSTNHFEVVPYQNSWPYEVHVHRNLVLEETPTPSLFPAEAAKISGELPGKVTP